MLQYAAFRRQYFPEKSAECRKLAFRKRIKNPSEHFVSLCLGRCKELLTFLREIDSGSASIARILFAADKTILHEYRYERGRRRSRDREVFSDRTHRWSFVVADIDHRLNMKPGIRIELLPLRELRADQPAHREEKRRDAYDVGI